jgi:hypothetical protein
LVALVVIAVAMLVIFFPRAKRLALAPCRFQQPFSVFSLFHDSNFRLLKVNFIIEFFIIGFNRSASAVCA